MVSSLLVHSLISLLVHFVLILYGDVHDKEFDGNGPVYTDIDYRVVSDAAEHIFHDESPYRRATYRYSPLLAYLLIPNLFVHQHWGKMLFSICNVIAGVVMSRILSKEHRFYALFWLYNPMSIVIASRGSYEPIVGVIVLGLLWNAKQEKEERPWLTGILLGLAVHLKIYPIIYSLALYFHIDRSSSLDLTYRRLQFVLAFILLTLSLNGYFYYSYGYEYIYETYLYHIVRRDARHNFSPYFYLIYLNPQNSFLSFITFVPQLINTLVCSYRLYDRLELCLFALTFAFVTFNKVTTSQYFLWYLIFIPILLPRIQFKWKTLILLLISWLTPQALWLYQAYQLEFKANNTFIQIWIASILFAFVNVIILCTIIYHYPHISTSTVSTQKKTD